VIDGRDLNQDAPNVRVFFRMWPAQQTNAIHDTTTLYRTACVGSRHIALLGRQGDEIATIPFFAALRVNPLTQSMTAQQDPPNVRTIVHDSLGAEVVAYYGCWLDINQPTDQRLPADLARDLVNGPADRGRAYREDPGARLRWQAGCWRRPAGCLARAFGSGQAGFRIPA
jgi:hypothetical protein